MEPSRERVSRGAADTRQLGERLGRVVAGGDVIALVGGLGAGKTCFVQGLARGLGVPPEEHVASPTFNIVLDHAGRLALHHVDLYRVVDEGELDELGLGEMLAAGGVSALEWADRFPSLLPADHLEVRLVADGPRRRRLAAIAHGPRAAALLTAWLPR